MLRCSCYWAGVDCVACHLHTGPWTRIFYIHARYSSPHDHLSGWYIPHSSLRKWFCFRIQWWYRKRKVIVVVREGPREWPSEINRPSKYFSHNFMINYPLLSLCLEWRYLLISILVIVKGCHRYHDRTSRFTFSTMAFGNASATCPS